MKKDKKRSGPLYRQYKSIKRQYPDVLLAFPLGEFCEVYGEEDARVVSEVLGVELSSRVIGQDAVAMACFPIHFADGYIAKLLAAGHKVAVAGDVNIDALKGQSVEKRDDERL